MMAMPSSEEMGDVTMCAYVGVAYALLLLSSPKCFPALPVTHWPS